MRGFRIGKGRWRFRGRGRFGSKKAISTIMANLMMLVIVVFLSTLLFVWSMASFGAYQGGAGYWFSSRSLANQERLSVENVFFYQQGSSYFAKIYVRNVGTIEVTIDSVYLNSTRLPSLVPTETVAISNVVLLGPDATGILLNGPYGKGDLQKITLATLRGTTIATTWVA